MQRTVLVIGSGVAGLTYALKVAEFASVHLITKKEHTESNTNYAQGGIAAVMSAEDAPELHVRDTLTAGAGLCHRDAVEQMVRKGGGVATAAPPKPASTPVAPPRNIPVLPSKPSVLPSRTGRREPEPTPRAPAALQHRGSHARAPPRR